MPRPRKAPALTREEIERALEAVRAARELLSGPHRWTRKALARDARGVEVLPDDLTAVRWCVNGALLREGARIDGRRIRLRKKHDPGDIGISDVIATRTGKLAVVAFGVVLAKQLAEDGVGSSLGTAFVATRRGWPQQALSLRVLPEVLNDRSATRHRDIARVLEDTEAFISATLRDAAKTSKRRQPKSGDA